MPRTAFAVTLAVGAAVAVILGLAAGPDTRTFAGVGGLVLALMSVALPTTGGQLARQAKAAGGRRPALIRAAGLAAGLAVAASVFGALVTAAVVLTSVTTDAQALAAEPWDGALAVSVGGVLTLLVAQSVGWGLGLLIRRPVVSFLATIVVPLGLWFVLGAADALRPARWLTPYAAAEHLLAGDVTGPTLIQWTAVFLVWGVGLAAVGGFRAGRPASTTGAPAPR